MYSLRAFFWVLLATAIPEVSSGQETGQPITADAIRQAELILGLEFTPTERQQLMERQRFFQDLASLRESYGLIRAAAPDQSVMPALHFTPQPPAWSLPETDLGPTWTDVGGAQRPAALEDVAYWTITKLAELIRTRQVTSVELTRMYLVDWSDLTRTFTSW